MKGRKLTLQEVLNLEDGTKVWIEDNSKIFEDDLYVYDKLDARVDLMTKRYVGYDLKTIGDFHGRIIFYEWIEESRIFKISQDLTIDNSVSIIGRNHIDIIKNMAQEICNLRGLDLTDDNIRLIVEEFS